MIERRRRDAISTGSVSSVASSSDAGPHPRPSFAVVVALALPLSEPALRALVALALVAAVVAAAFLLRALRRRRAAWAPEVSALAPADVPGGLRAPLTALVFTSPLCGACRETRGIVRDAAPEVPVVIVDVRDRPDLARRVHVTETPTLLVLDSAGRVRYAVAGNPTPEELWTYVREAWDSLEREGALVRTGAAAPAGEA